MKPHSSELVEYLTPYFDSKWYLQSYPDVAAAGVDPWQHFVRHGYAEQRQPCQLRCLAYVGKSGSELESAVPELKQLMVIPGVDGLLSRWLLHCYYADSAKWSDCVGLLRCDKDLLALSALLGHSGPALLLALGQLKQIGESAFVQCLAELKQLCRQVPAFVTELELFALLVQSEAQRSLDLNQYWRSNGLTPASLESFTTKNIQYKGSSWLSRIRHRLQKHIEVSVVLPVKNNLLSIQRTVLSLMQQSFKAFELIVVDCSYDAVTSDAISRLASAYPAIKLIRLEQVTELAQARLVGLQQSVGRYVLFEQQGDWCHPDKLKLMLQALAAKKGAVAAFSAFFSCDLKLTPRYRKNYAGLAGADAANLLVEKQQIPLDELVTEDRLHLQALRSWSSTLPAAKWALVGGTVVLTLKPDVVDEKPVMASKESTGSVSAAVQGLQRKLFALGFEEQAVIDLYRLVDNSNEATAQAAHRLLGLYYLYTKDSSQMQAALRHLERGFKHCTKAKDRRSRAVLKAEALQWLIKPDQARAVLLECTERDGVHIDLQLALANLESDALQKLQHINLAYQQAGLAQLCLIPGEGKLYEQLSVADSAVPSQQHAEDLPLVSVIIPVFNAQSRIATTLRSLLAQTWRTMEILVVDDCSTDQTLAVVQRIAQQDSRIVVLAQPENRGPYVARNKGLQQARGEFVTCHDADDWSHPAKLETQVRHLLANPDCVGNSSQQARLTEDLTAYRRSGNLGFYNQQNLSSFMFRREAVLQQVGFWDSARFGADGEFIRRVVKVFGSQAVEHLDTLPLSFQRQSTGSLTSNDFFGFDGFLYGARREQFNWYRYRQRTVETSYYPDNSTVPVVALPEPCWPVREQKAADGSRYFDVVIASDFRLSGGSTISNLEEIKAQRAAGLRTAIVQLYRYDFDPERHLSDKLRELIDNDLVHLVVYGEKIRTQHLIVRYPPVLQYKQKFVPQIEADRVSVIINQPPMSDYGTHPVVRYDLAVASRNLRAISTAPAIWYPIGPLVRESIQQYHAAQLPAIELSDQHWFNIIDLDEWYRGEHIPDSHCPVIGRHSRDHVHKWPKSAEQLLQIYPDSSQYKVKVLGGADVVTELLGYKPEHWEIFGFGTMSVAEFLKTLDVFVYYAHEDWVESFGRVILEAMATGVPAILPPVFKPLFADAVLYAEPAEVAAVVQTLVQDLDYYQHRAEVARRFVTENFSYHAHISRLKLVDARKGPG